MPGAYIMCLVSSLISGCTGAATGLSVPARFANAVCGYALLLLNLQAARRHFGQDWARHFLPLVTVRNLCQLLFQQMANCTILPKDACVRPACMQEKVCEYQYSQVKAPFRGTPCILDALMGTQLLHVRNLWGHTPPAPSEPERTINWVLEYHT